MVCNGAKSNSSIYNSLYYELLELENVVSSVSDVDRNNFMDSYYGKLVECLNYLAELHVPIHYKNYYKFWWSQELSCLKDDAIKSLSLIHISEPTRPY